MKEKRMALAAAGVRRWHGDEFLVIQQDTLDPLQKLVKAAGSCIIDGCIVSGTAGNYSISAGIVAIDHADGFKIARFAAVSAIVSLPVWLQVQKTTTNKTYDVSGNSDVEHDDYTAVHQTSLPGAGSYLEIGVNGGVRFATALSRSAQTAWTSVTVNAGSGAVTGSIKYCKNDAIGLLYLQGVVTVDSSLVSSGGQWFSLLNLPVEYRPNAMANFRVTTVAGGPVQETSGEWWNDFTGTISNSSGSLTLLVRESFSATYNLNVNTTIPII